MMMPIGAWARVGVDITLGESGIATFYYSGESFIIPEGISASIITGVEENPNGTVTVIEEDVTGIIPAGCAVILRGDAYRTYSFDPTWDEVSALASNLLLGSDEETTIGEEGYLYFTLDNTKYNTSNSAYFKDWIYVGNEVDNEAHKAYLALPEGYCPGLAEMLETLENPHLQHTHGGCEICDQVTGVEAAWGTSADDLTEGTLEDAIFNAGEDSNIRYIKLLADVEDDIYVEAGTFTLDLNGHTISSEEHTLYIQNNNSNVTIVDNSETKSGKVISSGEGSFAVGIINSASVTIYGGTYESTLHYALNLEENSSVTINGGSYVNSYLPVFIGEGCSATITGGTFNYTGASAIENYGNLVVEGGTFTYDGDVDPGSNYPNISHNGGSIDLSNYPLNAINSIDVKNNSEEDITPGAETILLPEDYCFFDYSDHTPVTVLVYGGFYYIDVEPAKYTIAFNAGDGEGEMEGEIIYEGDYTLPECTFNAPEGMMFDGWQVGDDEESLYQPGEEIPVTADTEIKAVWTEFVPQIVINMSDSYGDGWEGASITVKKDGEELDETVTIEDGTEATVTLVYDLDSRYTFYWNMGSNDQECEFEIIVNGKSEYTGSGGDFSDDIEFFFALGDPFVVSFNANDGTGSMDDIDTYESVTLPECTFNAPEGMMFDGWQVGDDEENLHQPGEEITVTADTEIKAVWTEFVPQIVINMSDIGEDGWNGASITVMEDGKELGTATVDEGFDTNTVTFTYDPACEYTFYWTEGPYDCECSFEIIVNGENVFEALQDESESGPVSDCEEFTTEEPFFTLEATAIAEAKWGTSADALTEKGTLAEAFEAAYTYDEENESYSSTEVRYIQLQSDVVGDGNGDHYIYGGTFTLDLNGNKLESSGFGLVVRDAEVTITDGSDDKTGGVIVTEYGCPAVQVDGGSVTIEGGHYESRQQPAVMLLSGEAVINGGEFQLTEAGYCLLNLECSQGENVLTITGGTFNASNAEFTMNVRDKGTITVKGGTFKDAIYADVDYYGGTLIIDPVEASGDTPGFDPAGFSVRMSSSESVNISIPEGRFFFDNDFDVTDIADFEEDNVYIVADKTKESLTIEDNGTAFEVTKPCLVNALTYTRTLPNLTWNALYVPFEIPVTEEFLSKYDVAYINDVHSYDTDDNGTIDNMEMELIKIKSGTLKGNYPYLIRAKSSEDLALTITVTNTVLYSTKESLCNSVYCSSAFTEFHICGTYEQMAEPDIMEICDSYVGETKAGLVVAGDGSWKSMADDAVLNPFRLYMVMVTSGDSPVKVDPAAFSRVRIRIQGEGGETGIEVVETTVDGKQPTVIYDLMGRRVAVPQKGTIYVVNGKKVMWK